MKTVGKIKKDDLRTWIKSAMYSLKSLIRSASTVIARNAGSLTNLSRTYTHTRKRV